ncbi:hypothetical protein [Streptomyces humicola]|nr:hypothetical protein [Streptomyces humicola]
MVMAGAGLDQAGIAKVLDEISTSITDSILDQPRPDTPRGR